MPNAVSPLSVRPSIVMSLATTAIACVLGCSGEPTASNDLGPVARSIAIHILLDGRRVEPELDVGALGAIAFTLAEEDAEGRLTRVTGRKVVWGSTYSAVADAYAGVDNGFALVRRNGRARIIAELDGLRDTVALDIIQVAVAARVVADTVVILTDDAVDLGGGGGRQDPLDVPVVRVDSNGFPVASFDEVRFSAPGDPPFAAIPDQAGNLVGMRGLRPGTGTLIVTLGDRSDTVLVQVTDAYRVIRLVETPSGLLRVFPDTARITRGAAVLFQNEASFAAHVTGGDPAQRWRAGPILERGREAQLFTEPDTYTYGWGGASRVIVVTP